ncbi:MAG TPA: PDZ domain-containing protein [Bryobacteraceae bacterium]|nr:PDZ domain-containing protein [Bryobacteraceae bacterium]
MKYASATGWILSAVLSVPLLSPMPLSAQPPAPPAPPQQATPARLFAVRGGYLGVGLQEITPERAKSLKLPNESGVEITSVIHDSPADKAGLKPGDVIVAYNGQKIEGFRQFSRMVYETPVGHDARLDIMRNGATQTVTAKIENRPGPQILPFPAPNVPPNPPIPDIPRIIQGMNSPMLGIEVESIDGQLADYFGAKDGGVLVRSVLKNSPAEKAGMKAGDVVLRVDDMKVMSAADISARLRAAQGKAVQLSVIRDHKDMSFSVTPETGAHLSQQNGPAPH